MNAEALDIRESTYLQWLLPYNIGMNIKLLITLILLSWLGACAVNPVTGDRNLILVSGSQELSMGAQNYAPMQQSQGGSYDVDPALTEYVQSVGNRLADVSDAQLPMSSRC